MKKADPTSWLHRATLVLSTGLLLAACTATPQVPARGALQGMQVQTQVDSQAARYYLERGQVGTPPQPMLDAQIAALQGQHAAIPSREALQAVSERFSVDFATLFLADRLIAQPCNQLLNQAFARQLAQPAPELADAGRYLLLFVPGWDYVDNGAQTGADFAQPRLLATRHGLENHLVPLPPNGGVEENARVLAQTIARHSGSGKRIVLASASSGGPAVHLALAELLPPQQRAAVVAWLNLGGILQGSPLVDQLQAWPQRWLLQLVLWYKGWRNEALLEMGTQASRSRFTRLRLPPQLLVVNYLGLPLSGQVSPFASDKYPLLRLLGPNDGLTLLTDVLAPRSLTVLAMGSDHFFAQDPRISEKTVALMHLMLDYLRHDRAQGCFD